METCIDLFYPSGRFSRMLGGMGDDNDRCTACGHLLSAHHPQTGCTDRVPGTMERMPGACMCGARKALADVIPFRSRAAREAQTTQLE